MNYFFTADEHYGHLNIIKYCDRPFRTVEEMDDEIIRRHNEVVGIDDVVYHLGDFTLRDAQAAENYRRRLNGRHYFLKGSHDNWLPSDYNKMVVIKIGDHTITMCHYAMRTWQASHYNSWQLFGHSHGKLLGIGKQMDVGVDTHGFYPYSFEDVYKIMDKKEDNFNLIKKL